MRHKNKRRKNSFHKTISIFLIIAIVSSWFAYNFPDQSRRTISAIGNAGSELASVILAHNPKTILAMRANYDANIGQNSTKKVRILIVPGHEPDFGGAELGSIKERNLAVELGKDLEQYLQNDSHYEVFITRDTEAWNPTFADYFKNNWQSIIDWRDASKQEMSYLISIGSTTKPVATVIHNKAPENVAVRLFGINKWANENNIDITIHIHLNDYANRRTNKYSGFSIYIPTQQYLNSTSSSVVAESVFKRLSSYLSVSNLPGESTGIVDEPDLIAIGASNTADSASMLIEYGYIYEPQFTNPNYRSSALRIMAYQTYLGLQDFFNQK